MRDMNTLFAAAETVSVNILVRGLPYRFMYAEKSVTPDGVRLILNYAQTLGIYLSKCWRTVLMCLRIPRYPGLTKNNFFLTSLIGVEQILEIRLHK